MAKEGDKKAFVGHDHGKKVEGKDGNEPTTGSITRNIFESSVYMSNVRLMSLAMQRSNGVTVSACRITQYSEHALHCAR